MRRRGSQTAAERLPYIPAEAFVPPRRVCTLAGARVDAIEVHARRLVLRVAAATRSAQRPSPSSWPSGRTSSGAGTSPSCWGPGSGPTTISTPSSTSSATTSSAGRSSMATPREWARAPFRRTPSVPRWPSLRARAAPFRRTPLVPRWPSLRARAAPFRRTPSVPRWPSCGRALRHSGERRRFRGGRLAGGRCANPVLRSRRTPSIPQARLHARAPEEFTANTAVESAGAVSRRILADLTANAAVDSAAAVSRRTLAGFTANTDGRRLPPVPENRPSGTPGV